MDKSIELNIVRPDYEVIGDGYLCITAQKEGHYCWLPQATPLCLVIAWNFGRRECKHGTLQKLNYLNMALWSTATTGKGCVQVTYQLM